MALADQELNEIEQVLAGPDAGGFAYGELRRRFPHLVLTRCDASDVTEEPFRSYPAFDLHLLDASDHCAGVTDDPAKATGLILAKRSGS
ncbi:hypothetical protein S58_22940 [Bradyrhizobium oligotrophicum S58]|uniref:Uncharacterized protein n=1 Tax=Bradyrhizobium oligotrophicum S58 TaxID=1245469 RepID=M4ZQ08_9BRAD|nr:hypothetical protein [Bradyrhizobium oligotrophicum]BAM88300.1 hypothetical protein S58_22940 [Bradyrhizobium oligotrophicum S58]